jgi:hypothetical protein
MGFKMADGEISGTVHSEPQEVWLCSYHISGNQGSSILVACRFQECQGLLTHSKFHFAGNLAVQFVQGQYNLHTSDMRSAPQIWTNI